MIPTQRSTRSKSHQATSSESFSHQMSHRPKTAHHKKTCRGIHAGAFTVAARAMPCLGGTGMPGGARLAATAAESAQSSSLPSDIIKIVAHDIASDVTHHATPGKIACTVQTIQEHVQSQMSGHHCKRWTVPTQPSRKHMQSDAKLRGLHCS